MSCFETCLKACIFKHVILLELKFVLIDHRKIVHICNFMFCPETITEYLSFVQLSFFIVNKILWPDLKVFDLLNEDENVQCLLRSTKGFHEMIKTKHQGQSACSSLSGVKLRYSVVFTKV